jgi:hypothetical protein
MVYLDTPLPSQQGYLYRFSVQSQTILPDHIFMDSGNLLSSAIQQSYSQLQPVLSLTELPGFDYLTCVNISQSVYGQASVAARMSVVSGY